MNLKNRTLLFALLFTTAGFIITVSGLIWAIVGDVSFGIFMLFSLPISFTGLVLSLLARRDVHSGLSLFTLCFSIINSAGIFMIAAISAAAA